MSDDNDERVVHLEIRFTFFLLRNNVIAGAAAGAIILGISVIAAIFYFRRKKRYSNTTVINTTVVTPGQSFLPPIQMWTPAPSAPTTQPDSHLSP